MNNKNRLFCIFDKAKSNLYACENFQIYSFPIFFIDDSYSQAPSIEWQKCYGGTGGQACYCIKPTSDGGSVACGVSISQPGPGGDITSVYGSNDSWVIKLDVAGTLLWQTSLAGNGLADANYIQQTADDGYIIGGGTGNGSDENYWIAKLNSAGAFVWQRSYGGSEYDMAYSIQQTTDGGYIVAGQTNSSNGDITGYHGSGDCWILKLDNLGNLVWQRTLGGSAIDIAYDIKQTPDGGYIVGGGTSSFDGDVANPAQAVGIVWVIKLDESGNIQWQKLYGSIQAFSICLTSDGGYAFTSNCFNSNNGVTGNHGAEDFWIVRLDASGNPLWQKAFGGSTADQPHSISQCADGGFIVLGRTQSFNGDVVGLHGLFDYWIVKVSAAGIPEWTKTLGGNNMESGYSIYQSTDGGYMVAGSSASNNNGDVGTNHGASDFWIVKLVPDVIPVTLSNFNAAAKGQDVVCEWKTMQEQNSDHFVVESSKDGIHFSEAGTIRAAGNSSIPLHYNFTDKNTSSNGKEYLYYKLKMVDIDGSFKYSYTIKVKLNYASLIKIYPNPVTDVITIDLVSLVNEEVIISLIDHDGRKIIQKSSPVNQGRNIIPLNTTLLSKGSYILSLSGKNNYIQKFIKITR